MIQHTIVLSWATPKNDIIYGCGMWSKTTARQDSIHAISAAYVTSYNWTGLWGKISFSVAEPVKINLLGQRRKIIIGLNSIAINKYIWSIPEDKVIHEKWTPYLWPIGTPMFWDTPILVWARSPKQWMPTLLLEVMHSLLLLMSSCMWLCRILTVPLYVLV